jgi:hypothetical protein
MFCGMMRTVCLGLRKNGTVVTMYSFETVRVPIFMPERLAKLGVMERTSFPAAGISTPKTPIGAGGGAGGAAGGVVVGGAIGATETGTFLRGAACAPVPTIAAAAKDLTRTPPSRRRCVRR